MRFVSRRRLLVLFAAAVGALALVIGPRYVAAVRAGGQKPVDPFLIPGNLYYVGTNDVTAFLLTGPMGHVLIGDGRNASAPMIMASINRLGFRITDVKVLLNSHSHFDHAGALAELQKASGAELWISAGDAAVVAAGGAGDSSLGPWRLASYLPFARYPPPRIDHQFEDGAKIRLGPIELTAHITPGHTPGSTSWSFPVRDGDRELLAVSICDVSRPLGVSRGGPDPYGRIQADFDRTFATLRSLPADIFLASHARDFGRWRKLQERARGGNPADPFIDRPGYLSYVNRLEREIDAWLVNKQ